MEVTYRDEVGYVMVVANGAVTFDGRFAYFSDKNDKDYKIPINMIICVEVEE